MTIFDKSGQNEEANESFDQNMTIFDDRSDQFEDTFKNILEDSDLNEESEIEVNTKYPNEAYADLMTLVTKYKLNNETCNSIIKYFNKQDRNSKRLNSIHSSR
jgi:hypothetical protein